MGGHADQAKGIASHLVRMQSPEEREVARKKQELAILESQLAEAELDLLTLQAHLRAFEIEYLHVVGRRYAELDRLQAEIEEALSRLHPEDAPQAQKADQARRQAHETAHAVGDAASTPKPSREFAASDDLKSTYRQAAKEMHPDLASDPQEHQIRQQFMARANNAYEAEDLELLRQVIREWQERPEAIVGDGPGAELVRLIRKIAQAKERIAGISEDMERLHESELGRLLKRVVEVKQARGDLLAEMAAAVASQIDAARKRLHGIRDDINGNGKNERQDKHHY